MKSQALPLPIFAPQIFPGIRKILSLLFQYQTGKKKKGPSTDFFILPFRAKVSLFHLLRLAHAKRGFFFTSFFFWIYREEIQLVCARKSPFFPLKNKIHISHFSLPPCEKAKNIARRNVKRFGKKSEASLFLFSRLIFSAAAGISIIFCSVDAERPFSYFCRCNFSMPESDTFFALQETLAFSSYHVCPLLVFCVQKVIR